MENLDRPEHGDQANDVDSENVIQHLISDNEDIEDLIFQNALIIPEHPRPQSTKIIGPDCSFHGQLQAKNHDNSEYKFSHKKHFAKIEKNQFENNHGAFPHYNLHIHLICKL